jgi:hypothetical protein
MRKALIIFVLVLFVLPAVLTAQGYIQQISNTGSVDWSSQVIVCTGIGAANPNLPASARRAGALQAAKMDALRNILATVKGIYLTSETTVENAMLASDVIRSRVEGYIRNFTIVDTRYMSTMDVEVDVQVDLKGNLSNFLLPENFGGGTLMTGGRLLCPTCMQPWPMNKPVPPGVTLVQAGGGGSAGSTTAGGTEASIQYTGLIIDCKGLGLRPAMAPQIIDEKGEEVYGSKFVSREYAVDIGMAGYEKDMGRARANSRVTDNPLLVKGVNVTGPNKTDVVLSNGDAVQVHNAAANDNFLQRCRVIFVLD